MHFDNDLDFHSTIMPSHDATLSSSNDFTLSAFTNPNLPPEIRAWGDNVCAAASPACTDPNCDDILPCPDQTDWCTFSTECLGDICYNEGCLPDCQGHDLCCTQPCADKSRCVSPCFGRVCTLPSCNGPTHETSASCATAHVPLWQGHQRQSMLSNSHFGEPCECIDPNCLRRDDHIPVNYNPYGQPDVIHQHYNNVSFDHSHGSFTNDNNYNNYNTYGNHLVANSFNYPHNVSQYQTPPQPQLPYQRALSFIPDPERPGATARFEECPTPDLTTSLKSTPTASSAASTLANGTSRNRQVCQWLSSSDNGGRVCGLSFDSTEALHQHLEKAHVDGLQREDKDNNGFYCHWEGCDRYLCKSFQARPKLKRHMQTHTLYKPYTCDVCGVQMKTKDAMEKHARTHTGDRPYECKILGCKKVFATSTELKTHMVVHSGEKPHQCPICKESFADSSNLSKHKKTHFVGMYKCPVCDARMKRWDQMRRHIVTQNHASHLLSDRDAQQEYKTQMEKEFNELSQEEKGIGKVASVLMDINAAVNGLI